MNVVLLGSFFTVFYLSTIFGLGNSIYSTFCFLFSVGAGFGFSMGSSFGFSLTTGTFSGGGALFSTMGLEFIALFG